MPPLPKISVLIPALLPSGEPSPVFRPVSAWRAMRRPVRVLLRPSEFGTAALAADFSDTSPSSSLPPTLAATMASATRQAPAASPAAARLLRTTAASGAPPPAVANRPRVFHEPAPRLDQALLQARQRPGVDPLRQPEPPPQVPQIVGDHAQPQPHLVRPEPVATQPRRLHRLLAGFDPLLRRPRLL